MSAALAMRADAQAPRTRHRDGNIAHFTNRLVFETSPYLRQHAHNPVNWYPWGTEAFEEAQRTGMPVFLSVGYSTCHWCHVMEEESFEDIDIARLLNERYVAIKVDREERPDVDAVYMTAVQVLSSQGGWPMSVWLDAERRPFFAGTYFPARDGQRGARKGFASILRELSDIYHQDAGRVAEAVNAITDSIRSAMTGVSNGEALPGSEALTAAAAFYERVYDSTYGGIRGAPKFPSSLPVRFLLRRYHRTHDAASLEMATHTLAMIAAGGMHDQLAGGFHRYSTDERWLIPHFEKMLYDNALLALAYAEAWQVTKRRDFARVLRTTLDYVLRDMMSPTGAFFSATDADSEGEEGTFFVWGEDEIRRLLGTEAERFMRFYGVTSQSNFENGNVLFVPHPNEHEWEALVGARVKLLKAREARPHPLRDEKILTAWNGLMMSALAVGGAVLGEPRYARAAASAGTFILNELRKGDRLQRSWKDGRASGPGFLEDDAFFVAGLLDLYEATFEQRWLAEALQLAERAESLFADDENGGWFRSASDHEELIAREKLNYDGAEPAGASVALRNTLRLYSMTGDERWRRRAERALRAYSRTLTQKPSALHEMLLALDHFTAPSTEIVLIWSSKESAPSEFVDPLRRVFLPNRALLGAAEGSDLDSLARLAAIACEKTTLGGQTTAYVCTDGTCRLPTTNPTDFEVQLGALKT